MHTINLIGPSGDKIDYPGYAPQVVENLLSPVIFPECGEVPLMGVTHVAVDGRVYELDEPVQIGGVGGWMTTPRLSLRNQP